MKYMLRDSRSGQIDVIESKGDDDEKIIATVDTVSEAIDVIRSRPGYKNANKVDIFNQVLGGKRIKVSDEPAPMRPARIKRRVRE